MLVESLKNDVKDVLENSPNIRPVISVGPASWTQMRGEAENLDSTLWWDVYFLDDKNEIKFEFNSWMWEGIVGEKTQAGGTVFVPYSKGNVSSYEIKYLECSECECEGFQQQDGSWYCPACY